MRDSTTIRVSPGHRDALRQLADVDGTTLDDELGRILRAERQRRMGTALAAPHSPGEREWLDLGAAVVVDDARR